VPTVVVAVATVSALEVSVAVRTQAPVTLIVSAANVATPAAATAVVVPPRVHGDVIAMVSVAPVPDVTTLPLTSSTEALKAVSTVLAVVTVVGGAVVKTTWVGAPAATVMAVLVPVAMTLVESVATRVQLAPVLIATVVKVATPATAVATVVPSSVHVDVSATASVAPVPVVIGIPLLSSIETANDGRIAPAVVVEGGSVVKPTLLGAVVATDIEPLITGVNPLSGARVSDAVSAQVEPVGMVTALNVATPAAAVATSVPPTLQPAEAVEMAIVSMAPVPDVTTFP
jgi:hypothetical protein